MSDQVDSENELNSIELIIPYLDTYGSVRLVNSIHSAIVEGRMPYATLDEYISDPIQIRINKLLKIQNLGKKTAVEFNDLFNEFYSSKRSHKKTDISSSLSENIELDLDLHQLSENENSIPKIEDRYSILNAKELDIIERRYAINREERQTLEQIGEEYDVTRERIRQIESKALKKLRSPNISTLWNTYVDEHIEQIVDEVFGSATVIKEAKRISGEMNLSIYVVYEKVNKFLAQRVQKFEQYWIKPNVSLLDIQSTRNRLMTVVQKLDSLPLSLREMSQAFGVSIGISEAAVSALDEYKVYDGWVIRGNATSRKKRVVNILNLFDKKEIPSLVSLWDIKVAYWSHYYDKCSGRDLLICLEEHGEHFINLHELGWLCIKVDSNVCLQSSGSEVFSTDIPEELYSKPVKKGMGLPNCVYELFEKHGPQRLSDASDIFQREYGKYSSASMFPMLVYYAVFLRFAPGIIGIQIHRKNSVAINQAREILLTERDLDLYIYSRNAGPPKLNYPLWDCEMELLWAKWILEKGDYARLGALLSVAKVDGWGVSQSDKDVWIDKKQSLDYKFQNSEIPTLEKRFIDTNILKTAIAALSIYGFVNWMFLNQAIGWRVETIRVVLVLAVLIRIGVLRPAEDWHKTHMITKHGRVMVKQLFGRSVNSDKGQHKSVEDFLQEVQDSNYDFGWASGYDFYQLLQQIRGRSDQELDVDLDPKEKSSDFEFGFGGFMGEALKELIED